jgi:hypothetical protein
VLAVAAAGDGPKAILADPSLAGAPVGLQFDPFVQPLSVEAAPPVQSESLPAIAMDEEPNTHAAMIRCAHLAASPTLFQDIFSLV